MNSRRIIIVALGFIVLAGIGVGAWYLWGGSSSSPSDTAGTLPDISGDVALNTEADAAAIASSTVSADPIAAYHAYSDGSVVTVGRDGRIARRRDGSVVSLSEAPVASFTSAAFSADGAKALVLTGAQPRSQVNVFDVQTASWRVVPGTFRDAAWAPRGSQLATLTPDLKTGRTAVSLYDAATGRTTQTLVTLALGDASVAWPAAGTVVVADKPTARSTGSAWAIDVATRRISLLARGGNGFTALWDGTGRNGIAFEAKAFGNGGATSVILDRVPAAKLSFTTLPDKCAFASLPGAGSSTTPYVVCGVPRDQDGFQRFTLPDAWLRRMAFTDDVIVGINLETKTVDFTVSPPLPVDIGSLQVVGEDLYYLDRSSGKAYRSSI